MPSTDTLKAMKLSGLTKLTQVWDNELCAEHDGTVASFCKLSMKIGCITDYEKIFERDVINLAKAGKYAGIGAAGVVSVAGVAASAGVGAAPVAAALGKMGLLGSAATGTAISSLSGAALTSASLAAVGGSMAAGTAIISASGLALGGVMGGVVANTYHGEDKSFAINKLREGPTEAQTIFINGFTQEKETAFVDWQLGQVVVDPTHTLYGVNWASKTNAALGAAFGKGVGKQAAKQMLVQIAKAGGKGAAAKLNPLGLLALISDMAKNPWHSAMFRAAQTGIQLAEAISRTQGQKFNLVGHSLGCRVIYYTLVALGTKQEKYIKDVMLLGGAVGKDDREGWLKAMSAVEGGLYNCHSNQDGVLKSLYRTANAGLSHPIGIAPISLEHPQLHNINCDFVSSHMSWKANYEHILKSIKL
ncbi:TMCO4 family protein [Photobacterium profundum]|uniref:DUF726 domain-containing protein n=1 Tax=Photobacterium profundum TaxID=74109 RepID=UPI003D0A97FF